MVHRALLAMIVLSVADVPEALAQTDRTRALESRVEMVEQQVEHLNKQLAAMDARVAALEAREKTRSADSDEMESIYSCLKITNARIVGGPFSVGDTVTVAYELTNTSYTALRVPVDESFSRPHNLVGTRQHWIERKGDESTIPGISPRIAREGSKYAAGGSIIAAKSTIAAGESLFFQERISTKGYPAGGYTYYIDYTRVRGGTLQTAKVDFELAHR